MDEGLIRLLMVLIGAFIGYRLKLFLVMRQEYNAAIEPIRRRLLNELPVGSELIIELESKLGNRADKIRKVYKKVYEPSRKLDINSSGFDDDGNRIEPVDKSIIDRNLEKRIEATRQLLRVCKLK